VVGDLVLVANTGSTTGNGSLVALNKTTGTIISEIEVGPYFRSGVTVQGQNLIFGNGYGGIVAGPAIGSLYVLKV